jgi:hypothetical protein
MTSPTRATKTHGSMRHTKIVSLMDTSQNGSIKKLEYHSNTMNTLEDYTVDNLFLCYIDKHKELHFTPICDVIEFGPPMEDEVDDEMEMLDCSFYVQNNEGIFEEVCRFN